MIVVVSACSLLGVFFVPLIKKSTKVGQLYKYFYSLMIALGASALFCDAVLHLIPEVSNCVNLTKACLQGKFGGVKIYRALKKFSACSKKSL